MNTTGPVGTVTRGTTARGRLRRVDAWMAARLDGVLRASADPLVVDLGFGSAPATTVELTARLTAVAGHHVRVVGLEIDPARVAVAARAARPPSLVFGVGGFELAGLCPLVVRAMNVLRQYHESEVTSAWATMTGAMAPGGVLIEGTCDEAGQLATWVTIDRTGPASLTLACDVATLATPRSPRSPRSPWSPAVLATRLPKALIHRNVPGEPVHDLMLALDRSWHGAAPYAAYGPGQRWWHMTAALRNAGWPVIGGSRRWHRGEVTVRWQAVAPRS